MNYIIIFFIKVYKMEIINEKNLQNIHGNINININYISDKKIDEKKLFMI